MNRRHLYHVGILVIAGLAVRAWLFMNIGVNGDTGLYLYDAKQILWGRQLLVEFPSRSPVMEYLLAGVLSLGYSPILSARAFMVAVATILGGLIYLFARRLHSHRAGLAAAALFYLTPFSAVWGLWVKTEQVAGVFLLAALLVALHVIDRPHLPAWALTAVGVLFGLAFLVRRVAIVHIGAFAIFVAWYRYQQGDSFRSTARGAVGVIAAAGITLMAAYAVLARFDPALTLAIADHHAAALVKSGGQGSLGWVELTEAKAQFAEDRPGWFAQICQKCGFDTIITFLATLLVAFPAILPLFVFIRSYLEPAGFIGEVTIPVAFGIAGILGLINVIGTPYWPRGVFAGVVVITVALLWYLDAVPFDRLWRPAMALPVFILLGLTAGYLYRDRIIYVTYFQDFYPYIVTLSGICVVEFYRQFDSRRLVIGAAALLLLSAGVVGAATAYPYNPDTGEDNRKWFSIELVQEYGADIEARTDPSDRVLTAQPLYVIESDRKLAGHLSRRYYLFRGWPDTQLADTSERMLLREVRAPHTTVVVYDTELETVYNNTDDLQAAVDCRFEPADEQAMYNRTGGRLLTRTANATC